jgi:hypothetical protein
MNYTRIYADANGESHFQDVEMEMKTARSRGDFAERAGESV